MASRPPHRRPNLRNLNPVFRKQEKADDDNVLTAKVLNQARKSGVLNLSGRGLSTVPEKVWTILDRCVEIDVTLDSLVENEEEAWWNQKPLTNLDLSSNTITTISPKISNLCDLTVLTLYDNALTSLPKEIGILDKLTKLNLKRNKLSELPPELFSLKELIYLNISYNCFESLSADISNLYLLSFLDISNNQLTSLPGGIGFLVRLTELLCSNNHLKELPNDLVDMRSLTKLDLVHNDLESLPSDIGKLRKLQFLYAQHNDIVELPNFEGCEHLEELYIGNNFIKEIPIDFGTNLLYLKVLDLRDNKIEKIPEEIGLLQHLIRLDLSNNSIVLIPNSLCRLTNLISLQVEGNPIKSIRRDILQGGTTRILKTLRDRKEMSPPKVNFSNPLPGVSNNDIFPDRYAMRRSRVLTVSSQNIVEIPDEVFMDAKEEYVSSIDLSKNKMSIVPSGLEYMKDLANELILSHNSFTYLPEFLENFHCTYRIDISCNLLSNLPDNFGHLTNLRELNLSGNKFNTIPLCIYQLKNLEILLAKDNKIEQIDATENGLGALTRLANLDLSNNNIEYIPPLLGTLKLTTLNIMGNRFRQPRHQILEKGTEHVLLYLRDRIPK